MRVEQLLAPTNPSGIHPTQIAREMATTITVVTNWLEELKRAVPTN
jgi:hypothetical protein